MVVTVTQSATWLTGTLVLGLCVGFVLGWKAHSKFVCEHCAKKREREKGAASSCTGERARDKDGGDSCARDVPAMLCRGRCSQN
jgi:hypothetical protein